jgi:multidrug efflux pump subunit AcrA (membrane-fusion protein)
MKRVCIASLVISLMALSGCNTTTVGPLKATGTVEATEISISSEVAGRVIEVSAQEGDVVKAGQVLVRLDDALLQSQLRQAEATLRSAKANYDLLAAGPTAEQVRQAEGALLSATASYSRTVEGSRAVDIDAAQAAYNAATKAYDKLKRGPEREDYAQAEAAVLNAQAAVRKAQSDYDRVNAVNPAGVSGSPAAVALEQATNNYNAAKSAYDKLARAADDAQLAAAFQQVQATKAALERAKVPARAFDIDQAKAQVQQAQAQLDGLKSGARAQQLDAARAQAEGAQAAVDTLKVQLKRLVLLAPADGLVLARAIEQGEVAIVGAPLLTLARLDDLRLTVYVPEDRYGEIALNQKAQVTVDSFPTERFEATVKTIAGKAEFTPRNVQTSEGRRTTVFAVRLSVSDTSGRLRPGMPADVTFGGS